MFINSKAKASRVLILTLSLALIQFSYSEETETDENTEVPAEDENPESEKVPYRLCQRDLLYAYGIENPGYIKAPGMLCKHKSPESCCSRTAESQLMEKWIQTDRVKLIQNIDGYYHILEGIFDYYEDIILFAKYVHLNPYSVDVCVRSARDLIFNYMKKDEIIEFMTKIKKAFTFLKESRRGFYCSLCDVHYQKYFDTDAKKIIMKTTFCQKLVENTVEAVYERVNKLLPILQNINVLLHCDSDKEDEEGGQGDTELEFGIDADDHMELNHCYNLYTEFNKPELYMVKCLHFCRDYRFSLGSIIFEGSLAKLSFLYDKILKKKFAMTDPVFALKDESRSFIADDGIENIFYVRREFSFTSVVNVYFESRYKTNDFRSFETIYEEEGIEPMVKGDESKFLFGHEDYLDILPDNPFASVMSLIMTPILILKLLF
jgi:hypothetical protein